MSDDEVPELPSFRDRNDSKLFHKYSPSNTHVKTYTAGEDQGRLADMAKQFGLAQQRAPRKQVRAAPPSTDHHPFLQVSKVVGLLLDPSLEDARMRAVYSSHRELLEEQELAEERRLYERLEERPRRDLFEIEEAEVHGGVGSTLISAVLGIIKGMVGPAILYLPHGFATSGYATALPIMGLATALYIYSSNCLLDSWKLESSKDNVDDDVLVSTEVIIDSETPLLNSNSESGSSVEPYGGNATQIQRPKKRRIMLSYPELAYRGLGEVGESMVKTGIALMQTGICLTYLIFVPQNLHVSMKLLFGWDIAPSYWLIVMIVIQVPLSWIRDIRKFTLTNLIAMIFILYGLFTCLGFALESAATNDATTEGYQGPVEAIWDRLISLDAYNKHWFLFIGTSVLLFEGSITLMIPLQEAVQGDGRAAFQDVYRRVILGIICFYIFFGIICWMGFGNDVNTVLTVSLPPGILATTVQFAYSLAVIFTFPLQNFPAMEISCRSIRSALKGACGGKFAKAPWTRRNFIASVLVCLLAVVAACTMDSLDKVVSLMGSLLGCPIAFVFPPLIHTRLDKNLPPSKRFGNYVVVGLGFLSMAAASFTTIITWNDH